MNQMPRYALFAALGALLAFIFIERTGSQPDRHRLALSVSMQPGLVHLEAELGLPLLSLGS
jgi:hypothetical protein